MAGRTIHAPKPGARGSIGAERHLALITQAEVRAKTETQQRVVTAAYRALDVIQPTDLQRRAFERMFRQALGGMGSTL